MNDEVIKIERVVKRLKPINKVGLDTDICICWMDSESYSNYQPNITKRGNVLFMNYQGFNELMWYFSKGDHSQKNKERIKRDIFAFLKRNKITLLKRKESNLRKIDEIYSDLNKNKKNFRGCPGDSDLMVVSIYKSHDIDCIFSNNIKHFEEICEYLNISLEKPFMIETGSMKDVKHMLRDLYQPKKKRKK